MTFKQNEDQIQLLSSLVKQSDQGMAVVDLDGHVVFANDAFAVMHGFTPEELVGRHLSVLHTSEQMPSVEEAIRRIKDTGEFKGEIWHLHKNGTTFPTFMHNSLLKDVEGNATGMIGTLLEITEIKQAEKALRESENRFRLLVESSPDAIFVQTEGRFAYLNEASVRLFGATSAEDLKGKPVLDRFHPEFHEIVRERIRLLNTEKVSVPRIEEVYLRMDGSPVHVEVSAVPIYYQGSDGALVFVRDITERKRAEEALKANEERFKAQYEGSPTPTFTWQRQGNDFVLVDFNDAAKTITNKKVCEFVGRKATELYTDRQELLSDFVQCHDERKVVRRETRSAHFLPDKVVAITFAFVPPDLVMVHLEDITERKQAEEALRKSEETLKSIFRAAPIGIGLVSARVIKQANDRLCEMVGYSRDELLGKSARMLYPADKEYEYVGKEKYAQISKFGTGTVETRWQRKDGRMIDVLLSSTPLDPENLSVGVTFSALDITKRIQAEEALRESKEKYRDLVENINDVIFAVNKEGIITYVSPVIKAQMGYSPSEVISKSFLEFVYHDDLPFVMGRFRKILAGEMAPGQYRLVNKSGEILWIRSSSRPVYKGDNIIGIRGSFVDITHSKHMEEQLRQSQKMEAIGTLTGGIAHDFNNILGIILGNAELAMDDVPEWNPARQNLEEVRIAILRAKDVVRQLLSFARKTKLEKKPTNIVPVVKESLKLLRSSIPTSIDIRQNIPRAVDTILADPTQINQVLINLCTNADHAMPDGGVIVVTLKNIELDEKTAAKYSELASGHYVNLTVSDTGHGISQGDIDRIFDPYFTTKEVGRGTGMGLAVVHGIVKGHNGLITVESELGKGTTFSIFFPVVEIEPISEIAIDEDLPSGKERIFFVDDEESIVKTSCQRLKRLGYKVESTTSPLEALDLFRSKPNEFDLVISDLTMPEMTGDKLVKEILKIRPDTPIIICTGRSEKMDREEARKIGVSGYLEKPHEKRDLAKMVRKVLDGK